MQTITTKQIEVISLLTTQVLIPFDDGKSFELNVYGTMAKFIATATIIDQEAKICNRVRFESELFCLDDPKKNIHEDWKKFHKNVTEKASSLTEYPETNKPIKL